MTDWQEGDIHEDDEYVVVDEEESDSEDDEDYSDGDEDESEDDIEDFDYEGELIDEDEDEEGLLSSSKGFFFRKLAVLGDSPLALVVSFAVLLLAVGFSFWLEEMGASSNDITATTTTTRRPTSRPKRNNTLQRIKEQERMWEEKYQELGPAPEIGPPKVFHVQEDSLESIREAYAKDGVVALRGLISDQLWQRLDKESQELIAREELANQKPRPRLPNGPDGPKKSKGKKAQFHTQKTFAAFFEAPTVAQDDDTGDLKIVNSSAFFEVAALSEVSKFGSKLMMPELKEEETVRMLRDIFLAKDEEEWHCGWHVDDFGFWPATASSPGINAWIALDDMPVEGGGGFGLAVGSHEASWREEAHYVTGATTTFPPDGFQSAEDLFEKRPGKGTCNIETTAPHLHRRMEDTKRVYELQKGDVIFHQRWLFHRTVPFERDYVDKHKYQDLLYRRYSVRFAPGSAIIPPGYGTELSVLWDERNGNRTADEVSENDGPWYPQVWPSPNLKELQQLKDLITNKIPVAEKRKLERRREMAPFLREAAKRQARKSQK